MNKIIFARFKMAPLLPFVSADLYFLWLLVSAWLALGQSVETSVEPILSLKPNVTSLTFSVTETAVVQCRASPPPDVSQQPTLVWKNPFNSPITDNITR
jgi:hypothetical protein